MQDNVRSLISPRSKGAKKHLINIYNYDDKSSKDIDEYTNKDILHLINIYNYDIFSIYFLLFADIKKIWSRSLYNSFNVPFIP